MINRNLKRGSGESHSNTVLSRGNLTGTNGGSGNIGVFGSSTFYGGANLG
jgi:hypothetical protein